MNVEEGRLVGWPFREFKGQKMGILLDKGIISAQDLGFAVERAYNERVRDAARILLLDLLSREQNDIVEGDTGPVNVIASEHRTFAERRQIEFALIQGAVGGAILTFGIIMFILSLFQQANNAPSNESQTLSVTPVVILAAVLILLMFVGAYLILLRFIDGIFNRLDRQIQRARKGQQGEERVLNILYHALDSRWWVFRNVELPGQRRGDIDFVLVGPTGVYVFEVKAYDGDYRVNGDQWERRLGSRWVPAYKHPTKQAKRNAAEVSSILKDHSVVQWVEPVVIWTNTESLLTISNPSMPVWKLEDVVEGLSNLPTKKPLIDSERAKIVEFFTGLYQDNSTLLISPDD